MAKVKLFWVSSRGCSRASRSRAWSDRHLRSDVPRASVASVVQADHGTWLLLLAVVTQLIARPQRRDVRRLRSPLLGITISARTPQRLLMQFAVALALLLVDLAARADRRRAADALADRVRAGRDHSRDVAVARPAAERRRCARLGLRPLRRPLRLRARLQRRPRARALRDDRRTVPGDSGRIWRAAFLAPSPQAPSPEPSCIGRCSRS